MKIKTIKLSYEEVLKVEPKPYIKPKKPNILFRTLLKIVSLPDLLATKFKYTKEGLEKIEKKEPVLILMNHSAWIDLEEIVSMIYPKPMNIVCTTDGFIGRNWLLRELGCIPTIKFYTDTQLVRRMMNAIKKFKSSVLMYPEAGYSIDGTSTTLPNTLGKCIKLLKVPVVTVISKGNYFRQPLYNNLRKRKVETSAHMKYLLSKEDIANMSTDEIQSIVEKEFSFDNWKWQQENNIEIADSTRAEGLNRVLYKCPNCKTEGNMVGSGTTLKCPDCGKEYELTTTGYLEALNGETEINHVPTWYKWQRECVKEEILNHNYLMDLDVDIFMMIDTYKLYDLGEGHLIHNEDGYHLNAFDGQLKVNIPAERTYSINADFYWYQIGDVITLVEDGKQYYCFPKTKRDVVTKMRLATEELYKIKNNKN